MAVTNKRLPVDIKKSEPITFKTTIGEKREIERTASRTRLTVSQLVRTAVRRYIVQLEE